VCLEPGNDPSTACLLADGTSVLGYLTVPDAANAYQFAVVAGHEHVLAQLADLPADYDLYLANGDGEILSQSVQDGATPEVIDVTLAPATYYLYVHVDPGRDFDSGSPYRLSLSLNPAITASPGDAETAPAP
jgi:hypothetical protein